MSRLHREGHQLARIGWLRAAVLGAEDGIVSTASLILGVAASRAEHHAVVVAGVAALFAGAMSMAAGEYVSVASQRDTEEADIERERRELEADPEAELLELTGIWTRRGVSPPLARQVAEELMQKDPLGAHLRDELGLAQRMRARPAQAAVVSAASFSAGASVPLAVAWAAGPPVAWVTAVVSLAALSVLGALAARMGGASAVRGALRVVAGGGLAMAVTAGIGRLLGVSIG
jgi:VIT1/CCC1 family predicted Fe2+/Mn2+ transporter